MRTTTKIASVLAVVVGMSFVLAGEAQAGKKGKGGSHHHHKHHYRVHYHKTYYVKRCHHHHYGYCSYYKRYGYCNYYVPAPVGGPPVIGTIPAPAPGSPAVVQPSSAVSAAVVQPVEQVVAATPESTTVVVIAQPTAQAAQTDTADSTTTTTSPSIDEAQLAAIVAAVQSVLEQPKQDELPEIDPEIVKALEQLIDQKMVEATKATETEAASLPEIEPTAQDSESEPKNVDMDALSAMLTELLAQQQTQE